MQRLMKAGAIAVALACALPPAAQALELRCSVTHQFYERRGEVVTSAGEQRGRMMITIDLTTGAFSSGDTTTAALVSATEIIALGGDDPRMLSLWVINRASGDIRAVTSARGATNTAFLTAEGQCLTAEGATQF